MTSVREKIAAERKTLVAELREAGRLEKSILATYEKESAKRHKLALKMTNYENEEDAPKKLWNDLRSADEKMTSLSRSIDGARGRAKRVRLAIEKLDSPAEFERRVKTQERLTELHEASRANREENGTMAAAKAVRGANPKSRAYTLPEADVKLVEKATKNETEKRYAIQCLKVKAGVRQTPPGFKTFDGLTEARATAIEKAVGFERPAKKARKASTNSKTKTAAASKKKTATSKKKTSASKKTTAAKPVAAETSDDIPL